MYVYKEVAKLPTNLNPNSIYFVRSGDGFNLFVTDNAQKPTAKALNTKNFDYNINTHAQEFAGQFLYSAYMRLDATGYLAQRVDLSTQEITEYRGNGNIPADLTTIDYE